MEVINDILGYKNRKIYQNDDYFLFSKHHNLSCQHDQNHSQQRNLF